MPEIPVPSEELKEALLKARGSGAAIVMVVKDGGWTFLPDAFRVDKKASTPGRLVLEPIKPPEVSDERRARVRKLMESLSPALHEGIEGVVEAALLEKSDEQIERLEKSAPKAKLKRGRGCVWIETGEEGVAI